MSPLLSHPSAPHRTQFGKRKRSSAPLQYLNQPLTQRVEMIKEVLPERPDRRGKPRKLSDRTIVRQFPKGVNEDDRILTGLRTCLVLLPYTCQILTSSLFFLVSGLFCLHSSQACAGGTSNGGKGGLHYIPSCRNEIMAVGTTVTCAVGLKIA